MRGIALIFLNGEHVNREGVLYLFQTYAINTGDFNAARDLYPNVIFAQFIAFLQSSINLTYATAAQGVGLIFFMVSSFFFLKILKLRSRGWSVVDREIHQSRPNLRH